MEHISGLLQFNSNPDLSLIFKFHFLWHSHLSLNNTTAFNRHPRQTEWKEKWDVRDISTFIELHSASSGHCSLFVREEIL